MLGKALFSIFIASFCGFISPVKADSWRDIEDLEELIQSAGTKITRSKDCKKKYSWTLHIFERKQH